MTTEHVDLGVAPDARPNHTATLNRRELLAAGAVAGAALASGGLLSPSLARAEREGLSTSAFTINFFAQSYTPAKATKANPHPNTELRTLADAYQKLHPNITINFLPASIASSFGSGQEGTFAWLTAQAAAGRAPDITWAQWNSVNSGFFPQGLFVDLKPYLQQPNVYVSGNKHWMDLFNPSIIEDITASNGAIYCMDCDYVATGIFYSKKLWAKAGAGAPPKTWAELMDASKKMKAAGIIPVGFSLLGASVPSWWERQATSQLFQAEVSSLNVTHEKFISSATDYAVAVKKGIFSMKNPKYAEVWTLLKDWSQYWVPGASAIDFGASTTNLSDLSLLVQGRCAMVWEGSWAGLNLDQMGFQGQWAVFPFPQISKATTAYSTNAQVGDVVGGPNAAFQYFVTSNKGNKSMSSDKMAWVLDWMQYISTPAHVSAIVNENPSFVPTVVGAKPANATLASLVPVGITGLSIDGIFDDKFGPQATTSALQLLQSYINGSMSADSFATKFDALLQSSADAWAKQNNVDLSKYL